MTATPAEKDLPPGRGQRRFAAIGYAIRALKVLPAPLREGARDATVGGVSAAPPPFRDVLSLVEAAGGVPDGTRWQARLRAERPQLARVRIRDVSSDDAGRLRARLYLPPIDAPAAGAALVWVHGGAFVIGSLDQQEAHWPAIELAAAGIPVLSVDYRLCIDGVHYPEPQDDVLTAWRWVVAHADELGVAPAQLHLGGGSAGGCLVAGATLRLRDAGEPLPASLYLAYPVVQGDLPPADPAVQAELATVKVVSDEWVHDMFATWAGPASWDDPYVSPGLADLTGLPPTYVLTCALDTLRRGSEPFVERLREAGVPVWQDLAAGARHATLGEPGSEHGEAAIGRLCTWLTDGIAGLEHRDLH